MDAAADRVYFLFEDRIEIHDRSTRALLTTLSDLPTAVVQPTEHDDRRLPVNRLKRWGERGLMYRVQRDRTTAYVLVADPAVNPSAAPFAFEPTPTAAPSSGTQRPAPAVSANALAGSFSRLVGLPGHPYAYATSDASQVVRFDAATGQASGSIDLPGGITTLAIADDGSRLYAGRQSPAEIVPIDLATFTAEAGFRVTFVSRGGWLVPQSIAVVPGSPRDVLVSTDEDTYRLNDGVLQANSHVSFTEAELVAIDAQRVVLRKDQIVLAYDVTAAGVSYNYHAAISTNTSHPPAGAGDLVYSSIGRAWSTQERAFVAQLPLDDDAICVDVDLDRLFHARRDSRAFVLSAFDLTTQTMAWQARLERGRFAPAVLGLTRVDGQRLALLTADEMLIIELNLQDGPPPATATATATPPPTTTATATATAPPTATPRPSMTVQSLTPRRGPTVGGVEVAIVGERLLSGTRVWFGNAEASVDRVSDGLILAIAPAQSAGTVDVQLQRPDGDTLLLAAAFEYLAVDATGTAVPTATPDVDITANGSPICGSGIAPVLLLSAFALSLHRRGRRP